MHEHISKPKDVTPHAFLAGGCDKIWIWPNLILIPMMKSFVKSNVVKLNDSVSIALSTQYSVGCE